MGASILELILDKEIQKNLIHNALIRNLEGKYDFGPHCHQNIELCFMQKGECHITVNGEKIIVREHEYLVLFSNNIHSFHVPAGKSCQFLQLHFSPETLLNLTSEIYEEQRFLYYVTTESQPYLYDVFSEDFYSCAERIEREINSTKENHIAIANLYIYELILLLSREINHSFIPDIALVHPAVLKAMRYINDHLEKKLTLDLLSEKCSIGKRYLMRLFQENLHVTVNDYINFTKINRAMDEIAKGEPDISELSYRLGFSSVQYFTTVFKKYCGVTPKKYHCLNKIKN